MPSFSFSLPKSKEIKTKTNNTHIYEVLSKDVIGTVCVTLENHYYIKVDDISYDIKKECYSCKGRKELYINDDINKESVLYIQVHKCNFIENNRFMSFAAGCTVKGNIVKHSVTNKEYFNIKKVYIDYNNKLGNEMRRFYKENYDKINEYRIKSNK